MVAKEKIAQADMDATMGRLQFSTDIKDVADADLVVEAVFENKDVKAGVFEQIDAIAKDGAILATNTSSISITELAAVTKRPRR